MKFRVAEGQSKSRRSEAESVYIEAKKEAKKAVAKAQQKERKRLGERLDTKEVKDLCIE